MAGRIQAPPGVPTSGGTFTGEVVAPDLQVTGLTGALTATRYVGGTAGGPPTSGTFAAGDFVVTTTGGIWVCTAGGSPGTWVAVGLAGFVRKTADEAVTSSNTLQDDDHLTVAVAANATYTFEAFIIYDAATTGDIKVALTAPASSVINYGGAGPATNATTGTASGSWLEASASGTSIGFGGLGVGTKTSIMVRGLLRTAGTAGSLTLQWAQNPSDVTATTVYTDSFLFARRVA
jgi:hypothetical protein